MQRDQRIVQPRARAEQPLAAGDHAGIRLLRQIDLIFDQLHHRLSGREKVERREPVLREHVRDLLRPTAQRLIVGAGGVQKLDPRGVVVPFQLLPALCEGTARLFIRTERHPPRQKIAAERHVLLSVPFDLRIGALERDLRIGEAALHKRRLRVHDPLRAASVAVRDPVVVRHAFLHLAQLLRQQARRAVEHHQNRRRAERPSALVADADGRAGHLAACAAMQAAHGADIVVAEEAHDEVALAQKIAALLLGHLRPLCDGRQQQLLQLQHFRDLPPVEHTAHQHQNGKRMRFERLLRAFGQPFQHLRRLQRCQQDPRVALDDAEHGAAVAAPAVERHRVQILPMRLVPLAVAALIDALLLRPQRPEGPLRAALHHMVEAEGPTVREARDEGVLLRHRRDQRGGVFVPADKLRHFDGKFIRKAHDRKEFLPPRRQRVDHGGGKHRIDIRIGVRHRSALGKRAQIQIDGGKPALAGIQQLFDLRVRQLRAAAAGIDGKLRVVQPELLRTDLIEPPAQPEHLVRRQEAVAAGDDQMHVLRQPVRQHTQKARDADIREQMEVVEEQIAGRFAPERVAQVVREKRRPGGIRRTRALPEHIQPRAGECILRASPEDGQIVGIDADAQDARLLQLCPFAEIPVHGGRFSVAHRRDHGRQRTARNWTQALLQALRDIDAVQIPPPLRHGPSPFPALRACFCAYLSIFSSTREARGSAHSLSFPRESPPGDTAGRAVSGIPQGPKPASFAIFSYSNVSAMVLSHSVISRCCGQCSSHWRQPMQSDALPALSVAHLYSVTYCALPGAAKRR